MRVALLSYNAQFHNAVGNLLADKVRFFLDRGAEVRLFVEDGRRLHPALHAHSIEVPQPVAQGPAWDYLCQADLIVAVYAQHYDLLQYLPRLVGGTARIVVEYLGVTPPQLWPDQQREGLQTSLQKRGYVWCADQVLTISSFLRRELLDATRFPLERVVTLPPAVDTEHFRPGPRERFLQNRLGIRGRLLLYVGRLAGNKRTPLLIEALARLDDPSLHAVFVGDRSDVYAEQAQQGHALAEQLGLSGRVHFPGQLDDADLPRAYRSADVLVLPSLHEGFCVPVIEAMACGVPVLASRSAALPGTVGAAGLTFTPNDAADLTRQLRRILGGECSPRSSGPRRVAIVSFRFGPDVVGGAETSLRTMAQALQAAGHHVEVFTTCTKSESRWQNDVPAGTLTLDGLRVQRFAIDPHDPDAHGEIYRGILEAEGHVTPATELAYLQHSLHSAKLLEALQTREGEFDAIITGPYLFGLTADIIQAWPQKTLLVPCFHDEALARLPIWARLAGAAAGILYHSAAEQHFAQEQLGVNHPNSWEVGTCLPLPKPADERTGPAGSRAYLVYCGRYSEQKNVPLLLAWFRRYQEDHPHRFDLVFMGQGDVALPAAPWLRDLGRVEEATKRLMLAGAKALIQLSRHESLSLVVLEAWAEQTPVLVHRDCAVLVNQVERAQGGGAVADYEAFAAALDDLWHNDAAWRERGQQGHAFVAEHYASPPEYVGRLLAAIDQLRQPLDEQMRARGLQHAGQFTRQCWQERLGAFVENVLTQPPRTWRDDVRIEPLRASCQVAAEARTLLLPVRLSNAGTHAAVPEGPGRTVVCCEVRAADAERVVIPRRELSLPALLMPGQSHVAALPVTAPAQVGPYRLLLWTERVDGPTRACANEVVLPLNVAAPPEKAPAACAAVFLETVQRALPKTQQLQELPSDYVDVTEGRLAPVKRFLKRKVLNNFKRGYVDVLSRQQSQVNGQLVLMMQQLTECCAMLDQAVSGLHQRLAALETRVDRLEMPASESAEQARSVSKGCQR